MSMARRTRCRACELVQFVPPAGADTPRCRRCGKALLSLRLLSVEEEAARARPERVVFGAVLPTERELTLMLIEEAWARAGSPVLAAAMIGMGKTTCYRLLKRAKHEKTGAMAEVRGETR